jgi:hypothetical protein
MKLSIEENRTFGQQPWKLDLFECEAVDSGYSNGAVEPIYSFTTVKVEVAVSREICKVHLSLKMINAELARPPQSCFGTTLAR